MSNAKRGVTMVELMLVVSIMGIIFMAITPLMRVTQTSFTSMEMTNSLKSSGQRNMNQISSRLTECKRLFENNATGTAFLGRIEFSSAPAVMTGSRLPTVEEMGSISPSTTSFVAASVGNQLLFASLNPPRDYTVNDTGGVARNVRVDVYNFNYVYVAENAARTVATQPQKQLWFWRSELYADVSQIQSISDAVTRRNTVLALYNASVLYAFNTAATTVTTAFYTLSSTGGVVAASAHIIQHASSESLINILTGTTGNSYRYGISPNSAGLNIRQAVPGFGVASGKFPAGFEVVVVGSNSVRQVFLRMVLIAQGARKGYVTHEEQILTTVRDLW